MPIENRRGLSEAQIQKLEKPYAHNSGPAVDYNRATKALHDFDEENPDLWGNVTRLLNRAQG